MGFLIAVVVIVVLMFGIAGWLAIALAAGDSKGRRNAEQNAPSILDAAFIGDDVVFKIHLRSPKYETVVLGAKARGYRLMNETLDTADGSAKTLIFEKAI